MATTKLTGAELRDTAEKMLQTPNHANTVGAIAVGLMALADVVDKLDRMENDGR